MTAKRPSKAAIRAAEDQLLSQSTPLTFSVRAIAALALWLAIADAIAIVWLMLK